MMKSFQFLHKTDIIRKFGLSLELTNRGFLICFELIPTPSPCKRRDRVSDLRCMGVILWDFLGEFAKMGFAPQHPLQKFFSFSKTVFP